MASGDDIQGFDGLFDAQMALPLAGAAAPEPFATVVKRDGRAEAFDTAKIASAIARASASAAPAEAEHAWDLAKAVRVHLWKQLGDQPPHVDQVHEAVERVLVAMARQRTALAYARYRVRRARQRETVSGTIAGRFARLEEDDYAHEALGGRPDALLVRTSADTLAAWDRGKIVAALARETGLRENVAEAIALEVEQQIAAARIEALTASLVRELVDAKLAEHGLGEYRERHRRLGVPLYDTALMLRGMVPLAEAHGPDGTDRLLARVLKKEYALAEVFSPMVAEAHLRGDLHIDGLGEIDRFGGARVPLEALGDGEQTSFSGGKSPAHFLARWRQCARFLRGYVQAPCAWCGVAAAMAPVLRGLDDTAIQQVAEMVLFEFAEPGPGGAPVVLDLRWPSSDLPPESARFCRAVLDTMIRAKGLGVSFAGVLLEVVVTPALFAGYPPPEDCSRLSRAAAAGVPIRFMFARSGQAASTSGAWLQNIAINLPRAARHAGDLQGLAHWLEAQLRAAAAAHEEKRLFVEELWARGADGPFASLRAWQAWDGFAPGDCPTRIAVDGLFDATALMPGGTDMFEDNAIFLLAGLQTACTEVAETTGARFLLGANASTSISERFASLEPSDLFANIETAPTFASGLSLPPLVHAVEAARLHGVLSAYLDDSSPLRLTLGPEDYAAESILGLLQKVLLQTKCPALEIHAQR